MRESERKELKQLIEAAWPELDAVIGWGRGYNALRTSPVIAKTIEEASRLIWSPFCVQNLSGYLVKTPAVKPAKGKKIGIFAKGCDSRALVALIQEKFIARDDIYVIGVPCSGTVDWRRVMKLKTLNGVRSAVVEKGRLKVEDGSGVHEFAMEDVLARRCLKCAYPNPVIHDAMMGEEVKPRVTPKEAYEDVAKLEAKEVPERLAFWQEELGRCLRCYACRNACPLCVCQDRCIAETRDPKWVSQNAGTQEKFMFHMIHALHLAGRCVECGECERVCPMEIPVTLMKEKLNQITKEILDYEAGLDAEAAPPLLTFDPSEGGI